MQNDIRRDPAAPGAERALAGIGLFGMGLPQRLSLALGATVLLAAATWWALAG